MGNTDFFDDDLIQKRDSVREVKIGPGNDPPDEDHVPAMETVPVSDLSLTPLARRKEEINTQVAGKMEELERLRARQYSLEREKKALQELRSNQEKYETGKREVLEGIEKDLVLLEREEIALGRRLDLLRETQKLFKAMDADIRSVRESDWPEDSDGYREDLGKALAALEDMRKDYHKSLAKLDALRESAPQKVLAQSVPGDEPERNVFQSRSFRELFTAGLAFNLSLIVVIAALIAILVIRYPLF
jgi:hypothetical protein